MMRKTINLKKNELSNLDSRMVNERPRVREVWSSYPGPAKSYAALQTVHDRLNFYASNCVAVARRLAPLTHYTFLRNTANIMKGKGLELLRFSQNKRSLTINK